MAIYVCYVCHLQICGTQKVKGHMWYVVCENTPANNQNGLMKNFLSFGFLLHSSGNVDIFYPSDLSFACTFRECSLPQVK